MMPNGEDMKEPKSPVDSHRYNERVFDIPQQYGDNKIVLMVRDPWTVFSYWEIRTDIEDGVRSSIIEKGLRPVKSVIRVYEVTGNGSEVNFNPVNEFELRGWASSWYIHVDEPGREWIVDIGIVADNGEFFRLARSNRVKTPPNSMSETCEGEWACPEELYYKMFAVSGGGEVGSSSLEIREFMEKYLKKWLSSGGVTSGMFSSSDLIKKKR
jgi:uncharacterized protein